MKFKKNKFKESGFTMVELIVAISVFSVAITLATGAFVRAIRTQRILTYLMSVNSNASLVVEQMAREIRTGYNFSLENINGSCDDQLTFFRSRDGSMIAYRWNSENRSIDFQEGGNSFLPLTASNVAVSRLCFVKNQESPIDPWLITLFLKIGATDIQISENILNLETSISSRVLPFDIE